MAALTYWILPALATILVVLIIKWIWNRRAVYNTWKNLGIDGPESSSLLLGNLWEIITMGRFKLYERWTQTYGKVFGYYEGGLPILVIANPDIAKEVLIKQFNKFEWRKPLFDTTSDKYRDIFLAFGEKWKRVRNISSPTFSGKKMKIMSPLVHKSIEKLMQKLEQHENADEQFDIYEDFKCLTLDVIASTVFSYDTDIFNTKDNIFLKKLSFIFDNINPDKMQLSMKLQIFLFLSFPRMVKFAQICWPRIASPPNEWFLDLAKKMITDRQESGEMRPDYLQLMLNLLRRQDGQGDTSASEGDTDQSDQESAMEPKEPIKSKFLTMEEMQGQTFLFLAAGYETTSTTLAFISYYLALYPKVQNKLQQEIDEHFPIQGENINYETSQKLPYLDMVFCEVSRLAYIGQLAVQRMSKETTQINGITIPQGVKVMINVQDIHMNPDLWGPEPVDQLVPERFLPERKAKRHPTAYLPFGAGPKNCIGMRFAIMETKMALINILQRYTLMTCEKTEIPLQCNPDGVHGPAHGVFLRVKKRAT